MTQNMVTKVLSPGTVIISAGQKFLMLKRSLVPVLVNDIGYIHLLHRFSFHKMELGGSVLYQTLNKVGKQPRT